MAAGNSSGNSTGNKTALVTGASMGIGREFARVLAENGNDLVLVARSGEKLEELARELHQHRLVKVKVLTKDLTKLNAIDEIYQQLKEEDIRIDHLINNAGFGDYGQFTETDWNKELSMIQLNITALTYLSKIFASDMKKRGYGRICNLASTAAFQPGPFMAVYFATKSYVLSFSEAIANELEGTGVTVTALCPGPTESGFQDAANMGEHPAIKGRKIPTSESVARFGYEAMMQGKPVAIHGVANSLVARSVSFLPRALVTRLVRRIQEPSRH
jgi:uncharacterized protein